MLLRLRVSRQHDIEELRGGGSHTEIDGMVRIYFATTRVPAVGTFLRGLCAMTRLSLANAETYLMGESATANLGRGTRERLDIATWLLCYASSLAAFGLVARSSYKGQVGVDRRANRAPHRLRELKTTAALRQDLVS